ncbi:hypothetical protein TNIN_336681 [Trichonephila inaurata madagascariensis]|uniref:Uncharacterized protein n=1 Tax=Trichonephila inaurata madagascariensis TaxID=2747483 RepID=A0A8X6XPE9_9ARAC|nr:hypothetical protein TNIN_336681 [Trichonephila inaurata madagascariensis]
MHKNSNLLEQEDLKTLEENDLIDKVAFILRSTILKMDKTTLPAVMMMEDLINGPEKLDRFFKTLIGGKDIRHRDGVNCYRLSNSLTSDAIYCVSNGTVKPSKHITLGITMKSLTSSRKMINILNRLEHCCNYNTLEELETEAPISSVNRSQICHPDIIQSPSLSTGVAFDNFDRYVDTLTGKDTLHDTVGIIYQNVSDNHDIELNSSSISGNLDIPLPPTKRRRSFNEEIPELPSFSHRLQMLEILTPVENEPSLPANLPLIETIDLLYLLSHFLHVPNTPMWTGFNSKIIKDTIEQVIDDLLHYQEVIDSHSSMPIELPNNILSRILSAYQKFVEETRQAARQCWTKSHSIRAAIISHLLDVCGLKNINPFDENLDKDSLYNIETAKPVPENVANFLLNIEKNGEDLRKQFITECAEDQDRFDKPIKKIKCLILLVLPKEEKNNSW